MTGLPPGRDLEPDELDTLAKALDAFAVARRYAAGLAMSEDREPLYVEARVAERLLARVEADQAVQAAT